jgi:hypothetical protein
MSLFFIATSLTSGLKPDSFALGSGETIFSDKGALHLHLLPTLKVSGAVPLLPLHIFLALALVLTMGQNFFAILLHVFQP